MSEESKKVRTRRRIVVGADQPYDASYDSAILPTWLKGEAVASHAEPASGAASESSFDEAFWREQMPPHWGRSE